MRGRFYTENEDKIINKCVERGLTDQEIGNILKRSKDAIKSRRKLLFLYKDKKKLEKKPKIDSREKRIEEAKRKLREEVIAAKQEKAKPYKVGVLKW